MITNEFLLDDRLQKIQQIINKYGEDKFYLSFSGGKDSCVVHTLIDMALPGNSIPRVFADTGIELNKIRNFVCKWAKHDDRIQIIKSSKSITEVLKKYGYPFKSKGHSAMVAKYQNIGTTDNSIALQHYLHLSDDGKNWSSANSCPDKLKYQFTERCNLKISDACYKYLKEKPLRRWQKENKRPYAIIGIMREEGGRRKGAVCIVETNGKLSAFQPLAVMSRDWERWFIKQYFVPICDIYESPYFFERTGCKGCPFNIDLQIELNTLDRHFPSERYQCEMIWGPVYAEYRRLKYRLESKWNEDRTKRRIKGEKIEDSGLENGRSIELATNVFTLPSVKGELVSTDKPGFQSFIKEYPRKLDRKENGNEYTWNDYKLGLMQPYSIVGKAIMGNYGEPVEYWILSNLKEVWESKFTRSFVNEREAQLLRRDVNRQKREQNKERP